MAKYSQPQSPEPDQERSGAIDQIIQSLELRLGESAAELQKICQPEPEFGV